MRLQFTHEGRQTYMDGTIRCGHKSLRSIDDLPSAIQGQVVEGKVELIYKYMKNEKTAFHPYLAIFIYTYTLLPT